MAPSPYTTTYTAFGKTYRYTYNHDYPTNTYSYGGYNPFDDDAVRAAAAAYLIVIGKFLDDSYFACLSSLHSHGGRLFQV